MRSPTALLFAIVLGACGLEQNLGYDLSDGGSDGAKTVKEVGTGSHEDVSASDGTGSQKDGFASDGAAGAHRVVFVSSTPFLGSALEGLAGADAKCQQLATASGLPGSFRAWLSSSTTSAASRLTHATVPYVLRDGTMIAHDWTGLTSGTLLHAINLTETSTEPESVANTCSMTNEQATWTGTAPDGTGEPGGTTSSVPSDGYCGDWAQATEAYVGAMGLASANLLDWTSWCEAGPNLGGCFEYGSIYCVEQ